MPKIKPLTVEHKVLTQWQELSDKYYLIMKKNHIGQKEVASVLNVTQQAISYQFSQRRVRTETMLAIDFLVREKKS